MMASLPAELVRHRRNELAGIPDSSCCMGAYVWIWTGSVATRSPVYNCGGDRIDRNIPLISC